MARGALAWMASVGLAAGCGGSDLVLPDSSGGAASIRVVSGDGQRGLVGEPLTAPVVVEVSDGDGQPVAGVIVHFTLTSAGAGAEITPDTVRSDADGRAQAHVLLGDKVGLQTGAAMAMDAGDDPPSTTFVALAVSDTGGTGRPPAAAFTWDCDALACQFRDASTDADGSVAARLWRFGDGTTSTEQNPSHQYADAGTYGVTLTVTDNDGGIDIATEQVTANAPAPSNEPPRADFAVSCEQLTCTFTDRSTDPDGSVAGWAWEFGDGSTSTERSPTRTYASAGEYGVTLRVTDDDGASDTRTRTAAPTAPAPTPNRAPVAEFEVSCRDLTCTFTDRSTDPDGTIASRLWDFGDGATSTTRNPIRTYAAAGQYTVTLRVTDDDGARDTQTHAASPTAPRPTPEPNAPPEAEFEVTCQDLRCTFVDRSTDQDGQVKSWAWDFGDGSTSTERSPAHTYASAGPYTVTLRVTDDDGAGDTVTHTATATAPAPEPNASPHAEFTVSCGELTCTFTDQSTDSDGTIASRVWEFGDGATSSEQNPTHTYAAGGAYTVTLRVTDDDGAEATRSHPASPTDPAPEPNAPPQAEFEVACQELQCSFTDRSQDGDGSVVSWAWDFGDGTTSSERSPSHTYATAGQYTVVLVVTDDDGAADTVSHQAEPTAPAPSNDPPHADFEVHCDHLACTFDDKSKDDDGSVVSWQWSFGDGATSTEQNPSHSYAEPGHYRVQLTVADDGGATSSITHDAKPKH